MDTVFKTKRLELRYARNDAAMLTLVNQPNFIKHIGDKAILPTQ
ncbi:hypothetical protein ACOBV8_20345 (plasmid) [Pseudoalteromonas espejiana]